MGTSTVWMPTGELNDLRLLKAHLSAVASGKLQSTAAFKPYRRGDDRTAPIISTVARETVQDLRLAIARLTVDVAESDVCPDCECCISPEPEAALNHFSKCQAPASPAAPEVRPQIDRRAIAARYLKEFRAAVRSAEADYLAAARAEETSSAAA